MLLFCRKFCRNWFLAFGAYSQITFKLTHCSRSIILQKKKKNLKLQPSCCAYFYSFNELVRSYSTRTEIFIPTENYLVLGNLLDFKLVVYFFCLKFQALFWFAMLATFCKKNIHLSLSIEFACLPVFHFTGGHFFYSERR